MDRLEANWSVAAKAMGMSLPQYRWLVLHWQSQAGFLGTLALDNTKDLLTARESWLGFLLDEGGFDTIYEAWEAEQGPPDADTEWVAVTATDVSNFARLMHRGGRQILQDFLPSDVPVKEALVAPMRVAVSGDLPLVLHAIDPAFITKVREDWTILHRATAYLLIVEFLGEAWRRHHSSNSAPPDPWSRYWTT